MEEIARGRCARIFRHDLGVLKLYDDRFSRSWVEENAERSATIADAGIAAPHVHAVESHDGLHGMVMEFIEGVTLWDALVADPDRSDQYAAEFAELHRQIHQCPPGDLQDGVARQRGRIAETASVDPAIRDEALGLSDRFADQPRVLIHGDLHPGNAMVKPDGTIVGIDWDFPLAAPAAYDMTRSVYLASMWAPAPGTDPAVAGVRESFAEAFRAAFVNGDAEMDAHMDGWRLPHLVARFHENIPEEYDVLRAEIADVSNN